MNAASLKVTVMYVLIGIHALNPTSEKFADFTALKPFANAYSANETDLIKSRTSPGKTTCRTAGFYREAKKYVGVNFVSIERYKEAFPELYRIVVIAIALPVSTAACKRSFSCL